MSDDDFIAHAGLDAWALIEFIGMAVKVLFGYALYGLTVMVIVMLVGWIETVPGDPAPPQGSLAKLSIANLRDFGSLATARWDRWLGGLSSTLGIWILTVLTISLLRRSWHRVVERRQHALADAHDTSSLTILVRHGSWIKQTHTKRVWQMHNRADALALWEKLFPGCIYDVRMVRDTGKLPKLLATRKKLKLALGKLESKEADPRSTQKAVGKARAALDKKRPLLAANIEDIKTSYATACEPQNDKGSSYFVLFKKHRQCNVAKQVVNVADENLEVIPCPPLTDVRWASLRPGTERMAFATGFLSKAVFFTILAIYMVPIAFVSGLLTQLTSPESFVKPALDAMGPVVNSILAAFMPTLALLVFLALLPTFCLTIAGYQGYPSHGQTSRDQFHRLFLFQFIWVFLGVTMVSGGFALIEQIQEIVKAPLTILTILGNQLAGNAVFFMVYLSVQFCNGLMLFHSRVVPIAIWWALQRAMAAAAAAAGGSKVVAANKPKAGGKAGGNAAGSEATTTDAAGSDKGSDRGAPDSEGEAKPDVKPEPFPFAVSWTKVMLATCLGVCYAPIQPVAILFALLHLCLAYLIFKRALLYSFTHSEESRCAFWPVASARLLLILFFCQLMLVGVHSIKGSVVTAVLCALTMPVTYSAHKSFVRHHAAHLDLLPLEFSALADEADEKKEATQRKTIAHRLSAGNRMSIEDANLVAQREQERQKWQELFEGCFVQPEMLEAREVVLEAGGEPGASLGENPPDDDTAKADGDGAPVVATAEVAVTVVR